MDINDRQVNAVLYIKEHGKINNSIYQEINSISKPTATRELKDLIEKDIISNIGTKGSSSEYVLVGS
jgi:ATP-dependent DNA helicase RecG